MTGGRDVIANALGRGRRHAQDQHRKGAQQHQQDVQASHAATVGPIPDDLKRTPAPALLPRQQPSLEKSHHGDILRVSEREGTMIRRLFSAAMAASLAIGLSGPAAAQTKPGMATPRAAPAATVDIRVCNRSGRDASVAVSYVEVGTGRFNNRGWFPVNNGACTTLVSTDNSNFYLYGDALDGSGRSWSGDHALCVQYPGPYAFWSDGSDSCPSGYETREFVPMHADATGDYTWNLDP
jgi:uncharacterized membrane protein